jgi:Zn-dependent M28 family amino/carboxypeptidase
MRNDHHMVSQAMEAVSADLIRAHIDKIQGPRHPLTAPKALDRAADYIWNTLKSLGYEMTEHRFRDSGDEFRNIIATHRGAFKPEERVIVLAHYDTVADSPGADDNASGVAVMLELARILGPLRFEKNIQFIGVNLEENSGSEGKGEGRRGSTALASHARKQGWSIDGVVVLESVAYAGDTVVQRAPVGLPVEVPKVGDFIAVVGNEDSRGMVENFATVVNRYGISLPCQTLVVPGNGEMLPDSRRSDHASFWDEGYRAIMITDTTNFRSPHYHLPSDTLETLNIPFAARVCRATAAMVAAMAIPVPRT